MVRKGEKVRLKISICCLLVLLSFNCSSPQGEIKFVLDRYDQVNKDFDAEMRHMYKDDPKNVEFKRPLDAAKNRCNIISKIDMSKTPPDFSAALVKLISIECNSLSGPADLVTYEGDPKTKAFHDAEIELEEVSARYGYIYKNSTSLK
jgi:hypothetical protein